MIPTVCFIPDTLLLAVGLSTLRAPSDPVCAISDGMIVLGEFSFEI